MALTGKIYYLLNEGRIISASYDKDELEAFADALANEAVNDAVEESGRDIDDLTPEELAEYALTADGGCYDIESIKVPDNYSPDDTFESESGDEFTFEELEDAYEE